jgi:dethiobiotin synthetase
VDAAAEESDAALLAMAAGDPDVARGVAPYAFPAPLAPMVAARRAAATLDLSRLDAAFGAARAGRDVVVVEGAGGLLVPITPDLAFDGLFARWSLGLLIVAPDRLGVINHARLTVLAAERAGLAVTAIVLNAVDPALRDASTGANLPVLSELLPTVPVVEFPRMADARDYKALGAAADRVGLLRLLGITAPAAGRAVTSREEF